MRKNSIVKRLGMLLLCGSLLVGSLVMSAGAVSQVSAQLSPDISILVDGVEREFYNVSGQKVHPIAYNGTIYLPVRAIGELMGKNVDWNESTLTVTLSGKRTTTAMTGSPDTSAQSEKVTVQIRDDFTVVVDGSVRTFTDVNGSRVYPLLYNGSTYLPIRAIGELMGKTVTWDDTTRTASLTGGTLVTDADSFSSGGNTTSGAQTDSGTLISAETAKAKALAHAGLTESQVTFVKQKLEWDDGRQVYDVEFYTSDYSEYDYTIDARSGAVLSFDYDADYFVPPTTHTGSYIGMDAAKEIALSKVPGATSANISKAKLDYDDGRAEYEVEIRYQDMEYDFEIDAYTGAILSWDQESIYD